MIEYLEKNGNHSVSGGDEAVKPLMFDTVRNSKAAIAWLLEEDNPAVKYRTQTEILGKAADRSASAAWIRQCLPEEWFRESGLAYTYHLTALAECGMTKDDIPTEQIYKAFDQLETGFVYGCADFMLITALIKQTFMHSCCFLNAERKTLNSILEMSSSDTFWIETFSINPINPH